MLFGIWKPIFWGYLFQQNLFWAISYFFTISTITDYYYEIYMRFFDKKNYYEILYLFFGIKYALWNIISWIQTSGCKNNNMIKGWKVKHHFLFPYMSFSNLANLTLKHISNTNPPSLRVAPKDFNQTIQVKDSRNT